MRQIQKITRWVDNPLRNISPSGGHGKRASASALLLNASPTGDDGSMLDLWRSLKKGRAF